MDDRAIAFFDRTPRIVPATMIPTLYVGWPLAQFGWAFGGVGLIFVWVFTLNADIASLWQFRGQLETVDGYVERVKETNFSEDLAVNHNRRGRHHAQG